MDIYNWDMVCAVSCRELNKKLKAISRDAFGKFSWSDDEGNEISGAFSGWEIVTGGSTQRINIIIPIQTGELTIPGLGRNKVPVDGLCPEFQVELAFVNAGRSNNDTHLKFNFAQVGDRNAVITAGGGSVVVLDSDINKLFPDDVIIPDLFCEMLAEMLVAMQEKFEFIFAEILSIPAGSDISWMKPELLAYAYNEKMSGELGCLAVLATLDDATDEGWEPLGPGPERQLIFDSALIREGGNIGFMLSRHMFMKRIVRPALPDMLKGSSLDQYFLDSNSVIRNNGDISLDKLNGYTPYFNSFMMEIIDDKIVVNNTYGRCDVVSYSSYVSFDLTAIYVPKLELAGDKLKIHLDCATSPVLNSQVHDTLARTFWILGGWVVDALVNGISDGMRNLLFVFGSRMTFDIYPINFNIDTSYRNCGLANNFYMCD